MAILKNLVGAWASSIVLLLMMNCFNLPLPARLSNLLLGVTTIIVHIPTLLWKDSCDGCIYAHKKSSERVNCPFCRTPVSFSDKERIALTKKRMDCNESDAYVMLVSVYHQGTKEIKRDYGKAVGLLKKATEFVVVIIHRSLNFYVRKKIICICI